MVRRHTDNYETHTHELLTDSIAKNLVILLLLFSHSCQETFFHFHKHILRGYFSTARTSYWNITPMKKWNYKPHYVQLEPLNCNKLNDKKAPYTSIYMIQKQYEINRTDLMISGYEGIPLKIVDKKE